MIIAENPLDWPPTVAAGTGSFALGSGTVLHQVRLEGAVLTPAAKDERYVAVIGSDLVACDLRMMSWEHFRQCRIARAGKAPDGWLPRHGNIADAHGCYVEIAPDEWAAIS